MITALLAAVAAGCGSDAGVERGEGPVRIYVSAPLSGPRAADGQDVADGAGLALDDAGGKSGDLDVEATALDDARRESAWDPIATAANARRAVQDSAAIAYIGDLDAVATRTSAAITNEAEIPHVSPGTSAIDLTQTTPEDPDAPERYQPSGEKTFARVIPDDDVAARAAAAWAADSGAEEVTAKTADDGLFARNAVAVFESEAEALGLRVDADADTTFIAGDDAGMVLRDGGERTISPALAPEQLPQAGQRFTSAFEERFGRSPGPYAAYGYEAMALVLQAVEDAQDAEEFRPATVDALLGAQRPDSVLGDYGITDDGDTTLDAVGGYRNDGGRPIPDRALRAPAP